MLYKTIIILIVVEDNIIIITLDIYRVSKIHNVSFLLLEFSTENYKRGLCCTLTCHTI